MQAKPVMTFATLAAAFLGLAAAPALAEPTVGTTGTTAPAAKQDDKSKRVCRTVVVTGSRMGHRVCRTAAEWEDSARRQAEFLEQGQRNGTRRDGEFNTPH